MAKQEPLVYGRFYHIYNRGNNGEVIFHSEENYRFFLRQYIHYIEVIATTFAYCLLPNHFHFLIYVRSEVEQKAYHERFHLSKRWNLLDPSKQFRLFFTSYAMAFNRQHQRTGSLFQKNFKRKSVNHRRYFANLVTYIHQNPQKHGLVADFRVWPWSSYSAMLSQQTTRLQRDNVLAWFEGEAAFIEAHELVADEVVIESLITGDWF
ncbi:MAG: hypothetical protein AAF614_36805 [Chloroflexota bacterium]